MAADNDGRWDLPAGLTEDELLEGYRFVRRRDEEKPHAES